MVRMQDTPITDAEMFIVRLVREATAAARTIADLRRSLAAAATEITHLKATSARQAHAIEELSRRVNEAEGRR